MSESLEHPTDWQVLAVDARGDTLLADMVPLDPDHTGLLSVRLGVEDTGERSVLHQCLQQCVDASVPVTLRWMEADGSSVLLLTTADGLLVVTACDRP